MGVSPVQTLTNCYSSTLLLNQAEKKDKGWWWMPPGTENRYQRENLYNECITPTNGVLVRYDWMTLL